MPSNKVFDSPTSADSWWSRGCRLEQPLVSSFAISGFPPHLQILPSSLHCRIVCDGESRYRIRSFAFATCNLGWLWGLDLPHGTVLHDRLFPPIFHAKSWTTRLDLPFTALRAYLQAECVLWGARSRFPNAICVRLRSLQPFCKSSFAAPCHAFWSSEFAA